MVGSGVEEGADGVRKKKKHFEHRHGRERETSASARQSRLPATLAQSFSPGAGELISRSSFCCKARLSVLPMRLSDCAGDQHVVP
jgi:hypothetical protein